MNVCAKNERRREKSGESGEVETGRQLKSWCFLTFLRDFPKLKKFSWRFAPLCPESRDWVGWHGLPARGFAGLGDAIAPAHGRVARATRTCGLRCARYAQARLGAGRAFELGGLCGCEEVRVEKIRAEELFDKGERLGRRMVFRDIARGVAMDE